MTVNGLENNYYLTQNDIWVVINGFTNVVAKVILDFKNLTTNQELNGFECSSSPDNDCSFNVCFPIRALMPELNHIVNNNLQQFQIKITAKFQDTAIADEIQTIIKHFIRGGKRKSGTNEWYLENGQYLIVGKWINGGKSWNALSFPEKIDGSNIIQDPLWIGKTIVHERKGCEGIVIKYLNSLGGYQYFYFDRYEDKFKTKASKPVQRIATRLRKDNFQNTGYEETFTRTLYAYTEKELQENFQDLVRSPQLFFYDPSGTDNDSMWQLIKLDDNTSDWNNYENVFENKVEFTMPNYRTIEL
ncbi:hypothetical protein PFY12_14465 [Chryseobacterium camelliae]|uniref:Uncharacterized protein n=1 Tax=Chryseobacterium camelliae TaxID=1265445 RepID=A0ABY7QKM7_9FLAO|nr:hypothetical protein [Chryseobacterium camelliae]WBV60228.1 hypothetical protein PFY12_14465 [Chryseobacterium camelliae]